jgi:hypothetical protein
MGIRSNIRRKKSIIIPICQLPKAIKAITITPSLGIKLNVISWMDVAA